MASVNHVDQVSNIFVYGVSESCWSSIKHICVRRQWIMLTKY